MYIEIFGKIFLSSILTKESENISFFIFKINDLSYWIYLIYNSIVDHLHSYQQNIYQHPEVKRFVSHTLNLIGTACSLIQKC